MRSGKFYRANERKVMESIGLTPVPGSGSGWVSKEDGENEDIICQLKSTDRESISIKKVDIDMLKAHALVSHKIPMFAVQFLSDDSLWLMIRPEDLNDLCLSLNGERVIKKSHNGKENFNVSEDAKISIKKISGSPAGRDEFYKSIGREKWGDGKKWRKKK